MKHIQLIIPENKQISPGDTPALVDTRYQLKVFDERVVSFAGKLSLRILRDPFLGKNAPFVALAFWLRKANMEKMIAENQHLKSNPVAMAVPIGTVFHVCPSNVDTMFVYSLMISLLVGNRNILRLSSKTEDDQITYLFRLINEEIKASEPMLSEYINVIMYERDDAINRFFSQHAQARVLWGGDDTARTFKKIDDNVRCRDLVFSDRISMCVISSSAFLALSVSEQRKLSHLFYNDAYTFDQKGCSSPQKVVFLGDESTARTCANILFKLVDEIAIHEYEQDDYSLASMKYNQLVHDAMLDHISEFKIYSSRLYEVNERYVGSTEHHCGGGYFHSIFIESLRVFALGVNMKYQTISYFGLNVEELNIIQNITIGKGVDRIVPIGQALDFHYIWDGYNLIEQLTCYKYVKSSSTLEH